MKKFSIDLDPRFWSDFTTSSPLGVRENLELAKSYFSEKISAQEFSVKLIHSLCFQYFNLSYLEEFLLQEILEATIGLVTERHFDTALLKTDSIQTKAFVSKIELAINFIDYSATTFPVRMGNVHEELVQTGRTILGGDNELALQFRCLNSNDNPVVTPDKNIHYEDWVSPSKISEWWSETYIPSEDLTNRYDEQYTPSGILVLAKKNNEILLSRHGQSLEVLSLADAPPLSVKAFYQDSSDLQDPRKL